MADTKTLNRIAYDFMIFCLIGAGDNPKTLSRAGIASLINSMKAEQREHCMPHLHRLHDTEPYAPFPVLEKVGEHTLH
jgi:hypothetical protein